MTLPDSDRTWLSFGGKYSLSKQASVDFGYSHIFFDDAKAARAVTGTPQVVRGNWNNNRVDILSVPVQPDVLIVQTGTMDGARMGAVFFTPSAHFFEIHLQFSGKWAFPVDLDIQQHIIQTFV